MSPLLHDLSALQNDDAMRVADGGKPMRDDKRGAALREPDECLLHEPLGFRVERGSGLIEND